MNLIELALEDVTVPHGKTILNYRSGEQAGAVFSLCDMYRYLLWRIWNPGLPIWCYILLNPSKATASVTDPTITRLRVRTENAGGGGFIVANSGAIRETYSDRLATYTDPIGPDNYYWIKFAIELSDFAICGFGNKARPFGGDQLVQEIARGCAIQLYALKINNDGSPGHPLYVPYSAQPIPFDG